ncbi:MAG: cadmium resistance transporter [Leuconostoc gelidum]|jgi:cadmium resistance protein CadD (predicted permease)|uniref:Cadmium resistance transporter n=1 Tax=Leuconostoc gelidum subsp. gelidum TaxID=1607839 RepID=A0AB35FXD0_LEUGE|nr:cadmium resistance transporter [Leuconostoc gelidum]AFS41164.1 integral membrane protein [Leuconostoc gelidum JB7]MBZ5964000.1 cadmium resistance transporter [Leuconostoc gelidum subsp. gelidum]MBZ5974259.1 cadmium resistance transporter [Leuconostoc gelidum subsp. gelidum]MBZ5976032.1 cadmium resistance transporter [Leuconostoc gelidum subsp. gelidum]MBZ5978775.1 cadmium resistance transporter [Leuconostoc gelidum subsp. gelidum]
MPDLSLVTMLFIGVNLDFFVVLLLLLQKYRFRDNFIGYELGMLLVFVISAIAGQLIQTIIPTWAIGLLGLLPIYMGIKGENDDVNNSSKSTSNGGMTAVLLMYLISCGADNIAVYVPVLATMTTAAILLTLGYFIILTAISLILAYLFGQIPIVKYVFERWGSPISRIIYILIGLFVMLNTGLIQFIFNLF